VAPAYADDDTGYVAISQKCVTQRHLVDPTQARPMLAVSDGASEILRADDICINSTGTGTLGRVGIFTNGKLIDVTPVADGHVTIVRVEPDLVEPRFLWYLLSTRAFHEVVNSCLAVGSTNQMELGRDAIRTLGISYPPLHEQRHVIEFLDTETARIDEFVAEQEHLGQLTAEMAAARREWQFASRITEVRPLVTFLQQAPTYGVLVPSFEDSGVPFVRVGDILGVGHGMAPERCIGEDQSHEYRRTVLQTNDVLVSVVGSLGHSAVVPRSLEGANVARAVCVLRPRSDVPAVVLAEFVKTRLYQDQALLATGTDTAQPTLNMGDLAKFKVPLPTDLGERNHLADVLLAARDHAESLKDEIRANLELLREHRQALITAAVTGGIEAVGRAA